jgi:hypothetical protein
MMYVGMLNHPDDHRDDDDPQDDPQRQYAHRRVAA